MNDIPSPQQGITRSAKTIARRGGSFQHLGIPGAVILAILGLSGVTPPDLAAVSVILLGAALMSFQETAQTPETWVPLKQSRIVETAGNPWAGAEFQGGVGAIVLGILALIGFAPGLLLGAAVITLGAGLGLHLIDRLKQQWSSLLNQAGSDRGNPSATFVLWRCGGQWLLATAAFTLGILALVGLAQVTLILVGALCLAAGFLLSLLPARPAI